MGSMPPRGPSWHATSMLTWPCHERRRGAMDTPRRTRTYRSHHLDSERWGSVTLRPGDVVISTSMKAGTTWMQRIMSLLVFGAGPSPAPLVELSPWIDAAFMGDVRDVVATIEAQEHQR